MALPQCPIKYLILIFLSTVFIENVNGCSRSPIKGGVECSNENPSSRTDCGWYGITGSECRDMGCCYDSTSGYNHCFIGSGGTVSSSGRCDFSKPFARQDCGYYGIDKAQCERRNCCFDSRVGGANNCFFTTIIRTTVAPEGHDTQCLKFIKHTKDDATFYSLEISADSRALSKDPKLRPYIQVKDDSKDELRRRRRSQKFTSLNCWSTPDVDYGVQQVFERHINDLERDPNVVQERPGDANNPIEVIFRRPIQDRNPLGEMQDRRDENGNVVLRQEIVVAEIHSRHLNPNNYNHFPEWTTDYMRRRLNGGDGDIRFHLVANVLGGPAELYNMVPGHTSVNNNVGTPHERRRNDWPSVERAMRDHLRAGNNNYVRWYVGLYYDDTESGRPTHFTYMAILIYGGGSRIILFGSSENRQL